MSFWQKICLKIFYLQQMIIFLAKSTTTGRRLVFLKLVMYFQKCVLNKVSLEIKYNISIKDMNYNRLSNSVNKKLKSLSYFPRIDRFSLVSLPESASII